MSLSAIPSKTFIPLPENQRLHKRIKKTGTEAFIPHNILQSPKLTSLAARMKMKPAQQAAYTKALIEESGGDTTKVIFQV